MFIRSVGQARLLQLPSSYRPLAANTITIITRTYAEMSSVNLNVLSTPLEKCSTGSNPTSGYTRDGFCRSLPSDLGRHTVAAVVSTTFLEFSARRGNDLSTPQPEYGFPGLTDGCRWCLCAGRWKEAFDARGKYGDGIVPKVDLKATHIDTLRTIPLEDLRQFSIDPSDRADSANSKPINGHSRALGGANSKPPPQR